MRRPSFVAPVLVLLLAVGTSMTAAPASARLLESGTFHETFSQRVRDFCGQAGLTVRTRGVVDGKFRVVERRPGTDAYFAEHVVVRQRLTSVRTGAWVTTVERTMSRDLSIVRRGDLLTITVLGTGNATVLGPDGKAIARNPGQLRWRVVIDDNGTPDDFSDDEEVSFEVVKGSTGRSDDFCDAVVGAIG